MIQIRCDKCRRIMETIVLTPKSSYDYIDYWRQTENHLCTTCWVKKQKELLPCKEDIKQLAIKEVKDSAKPIIRPGEDDWIDDDNPFNCGDQGGYPPPFRM